MRSARADRTRTGLRAGALVLALLLGAPACSGDTSIPPPAASSDASDVRAAGAAAVLDDLLAALRSGDADAAGDLGVGAGRALLRAAAGNVDRLGLTDLQLRFVDDRSAVAGTQAAPAGAWRGTVEVRYRLRGWDHRATKVETTFFFAPGGGGERISGIGDADGRTPLWLAGEVRTVRGPRTLVLVGSGSGARYARLARRALVAVAEVLPRWRGSLVVEVPATEEVLDRALGATREQYANIAAVTASVDGSLEPGSPVHVFLNPRVFDPLGPRAAQVVLSHETTHVATGATFVSMPTWLLEGFADYVALAHAGVPVRVAAAQVLARIRKDGPPDHLPTAEDLAPTAAGLGATYEEAWLANRYLAEQYGEARLVRFYEEVSRGVAVGAAFRDLLGTTEASFVRRWSADSERLAQAVGGGVAG